MIMPEPERKYEAEAAISTPLRLESVSESHEKYTSETQPKPKKFAPFFNTELVVRIVERIKDL
jgi:hypothetical protein